MSIFTEEQIIGFIEQCEAGLQIKELCRKGGFSDATFYKWGAKYGGRDVPECQANAEAGTVDLIDNEEEKMNMVWHYAPWSYLPAMVESGVLRGTNVGAPGEAPMLWFSANQQWEPTATKMILNSAGAPVSLTFAEQVQLEGCIRFGMAADDSRLLNWKEACAFAGTPRETRRELERVGKKDGADPAN